jgi:hypothetical protein
MDTMNDSSKTQDFHQVPGPDSALGNPEETSRRTFLRKVGAVVFSALIVDATAEYAGAECPCGNGITDLGCHVTFTEGGVDIDTDQNCGVNGDTDQSCWAEKNDANCGKVVDHSDSDQSCSSVGGHTDANCYIGGTGKHDEDDNCTAQNNHTDNACGDCNDWHDSDEHCAVTGSEDSDQMCGHQHYNNTPIDTDDLCDMAGTIPDAGCGIHDNGYLGGVPATDVDSNCDLSKWTPDQNCAGEATDYHCATQQYSTQPDESCSASSSDEACMKEFDSDQNCSTTESDEHCFDTAGPLGHDTDEHCGVGVDSDEACSEGLFAMPYDKDNTAK